MPFRFSGFAAISAGLTGICGLLYLLTFILMRNPSATVPALLLVLTGVLASALLVGLYQLVRTVEEGFALWALLLGIAGAGGAAIHGAFDLASSLSPPAVAFGYANPVDPRGFLTFAIAGISAVVNSALLLRAFPVTRAVGYFGLLSGALLVAPYLAYLLILDVSNPLVLALAFASGVAQPIWYFWLSWLMWEKLPSVLIEARVEVFRREHDTASGSAARGVRHPNEQGDPQPVRSRWPGGAPHADRRPV